MAQMHERMSVAADQGAEYVADLGFEPAFTVTLDYAPVETFHSPRGDRVFRRITGGSVSGRITGSVYPSGGGEYSQRREDAVVDVDAHVLLRDDSAQAEWLYLRKIGYSRPDGYYRVTTWVDADVRGQHGWVLGLFFIGVGRLAADGRSLTIDYYEVA
ncbi:MAG: DUF3237 family protein [Alteraurantiacibacter sp.]